MATARILVLGPAVDSFFKNDGEGDLFQLPPMKYLMS
jgi:hypothetical protein